MLSLNVGFGAEDQLLAKLLWNKEWMKTCTHLQNLSYFLFRAMQLIVFYTKKMLSSSQFPLTGQVLIDECQLKLGRETGYIQISSLTVLCQADHLTLQRPHCRRRSSRYL